MKYFLIIINCFFLSCKSSNISAQGNISKKAEMLYNEGSEAAAFGNYEEAIVHFNEAIENSPEYLNAHIQLANLYQNFNYKYNKAVEQYQKILSLDNSLVSCYYNMALCYLFMDKFDEATFAVSEYIKKGNLTEPYLWKAELLQKNIAFAENAKKNPVPFNPINLGENINSQLDEYFPAITADNEFLYFTVQDGNGRYANEDIYEAQFKDGKWQPRRKLSTAINTYSQEGAHSISTDGKYLFFASNRRSSLGKMDIYISKKIGNEWQKPINMGPNINTPNWESQPVLSADSKSLYFVRKSKDGFGGADIYISKIGEDGKFGKAQNLGNVINTPADEQRPYIHPDGKTLYFASEGHPGMGGGDIFVSRKNEQNEWQKPENLGFPINTSNKEFGLYVSNDGKNAFIASERAGGFGGTDIYSFELPENAKPKLVVYVKGIVFNEQNNEPLKANIKLFNLKTGELYKSLSSDALDGSFLSTIPVDEDYAYEVEAEGFLPYSKNFSVDNLKNGEAIKLNVALQPIEKGKEFILNNIFFPTNEYALQEKSKIELNYLANYLKENPTLYLEVGGHTDDVGTETENLILSENRAKVVYEYLVEKGVNSDRITFKGYGETKPLKENSTQENRAKNRRTAFKVL